MCSHLKHHCKIGMLIWVISPLGARQSGTVIINRGSITEKSNTDVKLFV